MRQYLLILLLSFIALGSFAQSVPVSSQTTDQVIQGPCYIFSTIAALESRAIQCGADRNDINFNEWLYYSTCVLGERIGNGNEIFDLIIGHVEEHGIYSGFHPNPTELTCPNPDDALVPCIADFKCALNETWCNEGRYYELQGENVGCPDDDGKKYMFELMAPRVKYEFTECPDGGYYHEVATKGMSEAEIAKHIASFLSQGMGVITLFEDWPEQEGSGAHAVFIFGKGSGDQSFHYKDSWPGAAGTTTNTKVLDLSTVSNLYAICAGLKPVGDDDGGGGTTGGCNGTIKGNSKILGNSTYTLLANGATNNITWTVSSNLTILSGQGTSTIVVAPLSCTNSAGTISVTYNNKCTETKNVYVNGSTYILSNILVMSPNWNNNTNQTCPNSLLELSTDQYPGNQLIYQWSIQGATLVSGQGTPNVWVKTPSYNSFLTFKVRARKDNCPWGPWVTKTGYSSSSNSGCGGGQGFRTMDIPVKQLGNRINFSEAFDIHQIQNLDIVVADIAGRVLYQGRVDAFANELNLNTFPKGLVFVKAFNKTQNLAQSYKFFVQ